MNRVLLIAYKFPPQPAAGALRPGYLAQHLPPLGWDVTVLTNADVSPPFSAKILAAGGTEPQLGSGLRVAMGGDNPDAPIRRLLRHAKETLMFPDAAAAWLWRAVSVGLRELHRKKYDAIISTALPSSAHVAGWYLARASGLPWIADYRDLWTGNPYFQWGPIRTGLLRRTELICLRRARALTTVSEPLAQSLRSLHGRDDVFVIPNAQEVQAWQGMEAMAPRGFDITFTGSLYDGKRDPSPVFSALAQLRRDGHAAGAHARLHFYGPNSDGVTAAAHRYGVQESVTQHGIVPRQEALRAQRSSAALLLLLNMDPATAGEMGSKYLEYAGARRPMLAVGPPGSVMQRYVQQHALGWFVSDEVQAREAIVEAYIRYLRGEIDVEPPVELETPRTLANAFAAQLNRLCAMPARYGAVAV